MTQSSTTFDWCCVMVTVYWWAQGKWRQFFKIVCFLLLARIRWFSDGSLSRLFFSSMGKTVLSAIERAHKIEYQCNEQKKKSATQMVGAAFVLAIMTPLRFGCKQRQTTRFSVPFCMHYTEIISENFYVCYLLPVWLLNVSHTKLFSTLRSVVIYVCMCVVAHFFRFNSYLSLSLSPLPLIWVCAIAFISTAAP